MRTQVPGTWWLTDAGLVPFADDRGPFIIAEARQARAEGAENVVSDP